MKQAFRLATTCALAVLATLAALDASLTLRAAAKDVDQAFKSFWDARTPQDAAKAVPDIVASGATFDETFKRLRNGRPYSVPTRRSTGVSNPQSWQSQAERGCASGYASRTAQTASGSATGRPCLTYASQAPIVAWVAMVSTCRVSGPY